MEVHVGLAPPSSGKSFVGVSWDIFELDKDSHSSSECTVWGISRSEFETLANFETGVQIKPRAYSEAAPRFRVNKNAWKGKLPIIHLTIIIAIHRVISASTKTPGFFWTFRKKLKAKKTQAEKNSSEFSKKLKQIIRKLNISPTSINFFFPQKLII